MRIKYNPIRKGIGSPLRPPLHGRQLPGLKTPSWYKRCTPGVNTIGYKSRKTPFRIAGLKPGTKYKILVPRDNNGNARRVGSIQANYIDVTHFFVPSGRTRKYNTRSYLTARGCGFAPVRGRKGLGARVVISDPSGRIDGHILQGPAFDQFRATRGNTLSRGHWKKNGRVRTFPSNDVQFTVLTEAQVQSGALGSPVECVIKNPPIITPTPKASPVYVNQRFEVDFIQSFYIDPNSVDGAKSVDITDITLFVRRRPHRTRNRSGMRNPGINVGIIDFEGGRPVVDRQYSKTMVEREWSQLTPSSDGTVGTVFSFADPVTLPTGRMYGIAVDFEDSGYELWMARAGHRLLGTNRRSSGGRIRGDLYTRTNRSRVIKGNKDDADFRPQRDIDLKFEVHVAEYDVSDDNGIKMEFVNQSYEFFTVSNLTDDFDEDEYVYQDAGANTESGIVIKEGEEKVTGGTAFLTNFNVGDLLVLRSDNTSVQSEVVEVASIANSTVMYLEEPVIENFGLGGDTAALMKTALATVDFFGPDTNSLYCHDSIANTDVYFGEGNTIIGIESGTEATIDSIDDIPLDIFVTDLDMDMPTDFKPDARVTLAYNDGSNWVSNTTSYETELSFSQPNKARTPNNAFIMSTSNEVQNGTYLYKDIDPDSNTGYQDPKSFVMTMHLDYTGPDDAKTYSCPTVEVDDVGIVANAWLINNDATNEHTDYGSALTKHISKKLQFAEGQEAEDIRVIYNAYVPPGTSVKSYAKIMNVEDNEQWDEKQWTPLELVRGAGEFSDSDNEEDYIELEFGFPDYPESQLTLDGTVDGTSSNTTLAGSGTTFTLSATVDGTQAAANVVAVTSVTGVEVGAKVTGTGIAANTFVTQVNIVSNEISLSTSTLTGGVANAASLTIDNIYDGEIIKVHNPLFEDNYELFSVTSVDSATQLTLSRSLATANIGIQETGMKVDKLVAPYSGFNNQDNIGIVRYFNSTGAHFDKYSIVAVKTVLLSESSLTTPKVDDYRVIGVSA